MVKIDTGPRCMNDRHTDRTPLVAMIALGGVLAWLAISRPGNLGGELSASKIIPTLAAIAAVCYGSWRFHSYIAALATLILFRYLDPTEPNRVAFLERGTDASLLVTLWIGMIAATRQGRQGNPPWLVVLLLSAGVSLFAWYGYGLPTAEDTISSERMSHLMIAVTLLAYFVGYLGVTEKRSDRFKLLGITVGVPIAGLIAAKLIRGEWPQPWSGGDWGQLLNEWKDAIDRGSWKEGVWCWPLPWACVLLILFGLWRTLARGRKEYQLGRAPVAWLLFIAGCGSILALGARPIATDSLLLAAIGAILSVFGIADFIRSVVERIALEPPESGSSVAPSVPYKK